jgi:hypothetical protein
MISPRCPGWTGTRRQSGPRRVATALVLLGLAGCVFSAPLRAQEPEPAPPGGRGAGPRVAGGGAAPPRPAIRPYADVITKDAKTFAGLFKVHQIGERVL